MSRKDSTSSSASAFAEIHGNSIGNFTIRQISNESFGQKKKFNLKCLPYKIIPQVKTFKGRLLDLQRLESSLLRNNIAVVSGIGGIGKSQLVKKYATKNKTKYGINMLWINAESVEEITRAFKTLFSIFYNEDKNIFFDPSTIVNYVYEYFESETLIVFDNAISEEISQFLPKDFFEDIHIIITSQCNTWTDIDVIKLIEVNEDEALDIFQEIMKDKYEEIDNVKWVNLANQLGRLPLAIQIAGAYIYEESDNLKADYCVDDYIEDIKRNPGNLYEHITAECKISLADTFELSLKKIQIYQDNSTKKKPNKNINCMRILNICAHLNPHFITKELLLRFFGKDPDENLLIAYLRIIIRYSLLSSDSTNIYIHDQIQRNILYFQERKNEHKHYFFEILKLIIKDEEIFYHHRKHAMNYAENHEIMAAEFYKKTNSTAYLKILTQYGCSKTLARIFKAMCSCSCSCGSPHSKIRRYALLYDAVLSRDVKTVKLILKYSNKVNVKNHLGWTPLRAAVECKNEEIQELLVKQGALEEQSKKGVTQLHECLRDGHVTLAQFLLDDATIFKLCDDDDNTCLHYAAMNQNVTSGYYNILEQLVERVQDIDAVNKFSCSSLHICAEYDNLIFARLLISKNANILLQNKKGNTPLMVATIKKNKRMIQFLCQVDARNDSVSMTNKRGDTALHYAIRLGLDNVAVFLAKRKIDNTMVTDKYGNTAIHLAVILERNEILPALLKETQQNINVKNKDGDTPLNLAEICNYDAIIYLEEYNRKYHFS